MQLWLFWSSVLFCVLCFVAHLLLPLCSAGGADDAAVINDVGPVEQLRRTEMRWSAAWRRGGGGDGDGGWEWEELGDVQIGAPAGERAVTAALSQRVLSLFCEETWGTIAGSRRGRCTLQLNSAFSRGDVFFNYRVANGGKSGGAAVGTRGASHTCKLYEEDTAGGNGVEIGTVTYEYSWHEDLGYGEAVTICLWFDPNDAAGDGAGQQLPRALRFTGIFLESLAQRNLRKLAASSFVKRWGFSVLVVGFLYGILYILSLLTNYRQPLAAKLKRG